MIAFGMSFEPDMRENLANMLMQFYSNQGGVGVINENSTSG